jgi:hypothetical protein
MQAFFHRRGHRAALPVSGKTVLFQRLQALAQHHFKESVHGTAMSMPRMPKRWPPMMIATSTSTGMQSTLWATTKVG